MRTRSRLAVVVIAVASVFLASGASAAGKPQIVDPKGDNKGPAGTDIQSVLFEKTLRGKVAGLRVTLTLDAPGNTTPGVLYRVFGEQSECGTFQISSASTAALIVQNQVYMTCGTTEDTTGSGFYTIINASPTREGNKLVWRFKLKDLPKEMRSGTMSSLEAFVSPADPIFGIFNTADSSRDASFDSAVGKANFTY